MIGYRRTKKLYKKSSEIVKIFLAPATTVPYENSKISGLNFPSVPPLSLTKQYTQYCKHKVLVMHRVLVIIGNAVIIYFI